MKSQVIVYIFTIVTVLTICILCTITQQSCFEDRLQRDLNSAMELSISTLMVDGDVKLISNYNTPGETTEDDLYNNSLVLNNADDLGEFKTNFVKVLANNINNKITRLEVNIFGVDEDSGLLSVEAVAYFNYLNGHEGSVSCYRTIIINKELKS